MHRKIIGLTIIVVFAAAIVFGGVHSALEIIEATSTPANPADGEYVARLASAGEEDPALAALRYVCPFH